MKKSTKIHRYLFTISYEKYYFWTNWLKIKDNETVPTERELCEYHGISRMTVNKAIASLVNEALYQERITC